MAVQLAPHVPKMASDDGRRRRRQAALGDALLDVQRAVGEITLTVRRDEHRRGAAAHCATRPGSNISS